MKIFFKILMFYLKIKFEKSTYLDIKKIFILYTSSNIAFMLT